ncbi:MAG TPA: sodium:alanine symporter [Clostridiales bacterium]|nr:sodium:alanine symporter [Clostridiales bacterium]
MDVISTVVQTLNDAVWSTPLIALCLVAGVYFSFRMKFPQVRLFKEMIRLLLGKEKSEDGVTPFQAFATTVGGRVGVGNIAGVATAIYYGGPGAVFWMWMIAFLGAGSAFVESSLAQAYKTRVAGEYVGGPAYFIEQGIGKKWYAVAFAICTILGPGVLMPGAQTYNIVASVNNAFGINTYLTGVIICVLLALIIFGGVKRIGKTAEFIAPFMSIAYVLVALVIIVINIQKLPGVIALIFTSAFGVNQAFGGIIGTAIAWGVKRGVYSNEAGQGSGAIVSAAAECTHPAKQGLIQAFSVYVDTLLVCSATAFMVLLTGAYNVSDGAGGFIVENVPAVPFGVKYTQVAVDGAFSGFGAPFIAISVFLFAFTSLMAYYYQAESNMSYMFPGSKNAKLAMRCIFIVSTFSGVVNTGELIWTCGDLGVGLMAWLNIIAILILSNKGIKLLVDYEEQKAKGIDPVFDPDKFSIEDKANVWRKNANKA